MLSLRRLSRGMILLLWESRLSLEQTQKAGKVEALLRPVPMRRASSGSIPPCPSLVLINYVRMLFFLRGNGRKYSAVSKEIFCILYDYTPDIQPISIDEAFLDLTGTFHFYKTPKATAQSMKDRIKKEVGLVASIGIAPVKFVAKIASDFDKPDGLLEVKPEDVLSFLWPLPINKLWGVGAKTQSALESHKIKTIGDIAKMDPEILYKRFGSHGLHLHALAHGEDEREVAVDDEIKSVSHEHTFERDIDQMDEINRTLMSLREKVSRRLRKYELKGKTLTVKIRLKGFKTYTHAFLDPLLIVRTIELTKNQKYR